MPNNKFLSTPSGWRATCVFLLRGKHYKAISIHALRVEGDAFGIKRNIVKVRISIHALRVEGDTLLENKTVSPQISIHALRVEGDSKNGQSFRLFLRKREKNLPL